MMMINQHLPAFETAPSSPGSRTRDLAKRFESRLNKKSTLKIIQGAHLAHQSLRTQHLSCAKQCFLEP